VCVCFVHEHVELGQVNDILFERDELVRGLMTAELRSPVTRQTNEIIRFRSI
jgi:hypothetical protein